METTVNPPFNNIGMNDNHTRIGKVRVFAAPPPSPSQIAVGLRLAPM